jgi:hypothetical protein
LIKDMEELYLKTMSMMMKIKKLIKYII